MRTSLLFLGVTLLGSGCADHVGRAELLRRIEGGESPTIVDVRSRGEFEECLERLLAADQVTPGREPILGAIARAYRGLGRSSEAREWDRKAREAGGGGDGS